MPDFSCPCGWGPYHADDEHLGKSIRCVKCGRIITVASQDGRYTTSNQQIRTVNQRTSKWIDKIRKNAAVLRKSKTNRGVAVAAVLFAGIGLLGYGYGVHRDSSKLKSEEPVTLSPDEVAGGSAAPARVSIQSSPGNQATTFNMSTAVGLDGKPRNFTVPVESVPARPIPKPISPQPIAPPKWLKSEDDGTIYYPAKPISKQAPKADADAVQESPHPADFLPTGTKCSPSIAVQANSGSGELKAINGTAFDACVIVLDSSTQERVRMVYVKSQDSFTLDHLSPGNYNVLFATGTDWNNTGEHFNRNASYFEFGKVLSFEEEGRSYERHTITLNPVSNGNVHSRSLSEAEFHILIGKH